MTLDAAIVAEPTGLGLVTCHKGFVWAEVTLTGVAAHGSRPDLGVDAIAKAGAFLTGLDRLAAELGTRPGHPLLGSGSVHTGVISGGQENSSYPDRCHITVERRTVPGENAATLAAELRAILDPIAAAQPGLDYTIATGLERHPLDGDPAQGITPTLSTAVASVTGRPAHHRGKAFWTDAALLRSAGIPPCSSASTAPAPTPPRNGSTSPRSTTQPAPSSAPCPPGARQRRSPTRQRVVMS